MHYLCSFIFIIVTPDENTTREPDARANTQHWTVTELGVGAEHIAAHTQRFMCPLSQESPT